MVRGEGERERKRYVKKMLRETAKGKKEELWTTKLFN